jgi:hypothetical protein
MPANPPSRLAALAGAALTFGIVLPLCYLRDWCERAGAWVDGVFWLEGDDDA